MKISSNIILKYKFKYIEVNLLIFFIHAFREKEKYERHLKLEGV